MPELWVIIDHLVYFDFVPKLFFGFGYWSYGQKGEKNRKIDLDGKNQFFAILLNILIKSSLLYLSFNSIHLLLITKQN